MKLLDKLFENLGYLKAPRIVDIISTLQGRGLFDLLSDKDNTRAFLSSYNTEAYIYACVYHIGIAMAGVPYKVMKDEVVEGKVVPQEVPAHPLQALIDNPNPIESDFDFKESTATFMELTGDGFWLLDEQIRLKPKHMYVLASDKIKIKPDPRKYVAHYAYTPENIAEPIILDPLEVLHMKFVKPTSQYYGLSSVNPIKKEADTYRRAIISNNAIFRNGMRQDFVLETTEQLNDKIFDRLKKQFQQEYKGEGKAHGAMILEKGLTAKNATLSPKDLEYEKGIKLLREAVCSAFGVPPAIVGLLEFANYSNMEEQRKIFWQDTIVPKVKKWEAAYTKLARRWDDIPQLAGSYVVGDLSNVESLKENEEMKAKIVDIYMKHGMPYNSIAAALNLPVQKIPGGDRGYIPFNLTPIGSTGEQEPEETPPAPEPPEEEGARSTKPPKKVKVMTREQKDHKWHMFKTLTEDLEDKYSPILAKYFKEQEAEVVANLNKLKSIDYEQICEGVFRFYQMTKEMQYDEEKKEDVEVEVKQTIDIDDIIFDREKQIEKYQDNAEPVYLNTIVETAKQENETYDLGLVFEDEKQEPEFDTSESVREWIETNALKNATEVNDSVIKDMRATLIEGINEGESIPELRERIAEFYGDYDETGYKTERIARTETISASNQGALESYDQSGVVKEKQWLTSLDDRTRGADPGDAFDHISADGQTVGLDDDFTVSGEELSAPGDPKGSAGNIINCRCTIIPVVEE